jgi:hypothetical protein
VRPSSPAVTLRALIPCIAAGNRPDVLDMRNTRGRQARLKGSTVGARGALLANAVGPLHGCFGRARESRAHCARLIPHLDLVGAGAARRARLPSVPWEYVRAESTHVWEVCPNPKHVRHQPGSSNGSRGSRGFLLRMSSTSSRCDSFLLKGRARDYKRQHSVFFF